MFLRLVLSIFATAFIAYGLVDAVRQPTFGDAALRAAVWLAILETALMSGRYGVLEEPKEGVVLRIHPTPMEVLARLAILEFVYVIGFHYSLGRQIGDRDSIWFLASIGLVSLALVALAFMRERARVIVQDGSVTIQNLLRRTTIKISEIRAIENRGIEVALVLVSGTERRIDALDPPLAHRLQMQVSEKYRKHWQTEVDRIATVIVAGPDSGQKNDR